MRDEDYIEMMCKNKNYIPDHRVLQGLKNMDSKKFHKIVSYVKSIIRIAGCAGAVIYNRADIGFAFLLAAEVFGVIEEWKE